MMPAALIYALSDDRQRAALNRAHAARAAARAAASYDAVPRPARARRRVSLLRLRRVRECTS